jgi:pyruvate/2-oxoacid:ferredoxin oxidoreductase alpha subunit
VRGDRETRANVVSSIFLEHPALEAHVQQLEQKAENIARRETRHEGYRLDDAELVIVAYGVVARIARSAVDRARALGIRAGLFRPITLWPFPSAALAALAGHARCFLVVELSTGQMVEDVRLAIAGRRPVDFHGRTGGMLPSVEEILEKLTRLPATDGERTAEKP